MPGDLDKDGVDNNFMKLRAVYIIDSSQTALGAGSIANRVSIMYLFSKDEKISWNDKTSYRFKLKNFNDKLLKTTILGQNLNSLTLNDQKEKLITRIYIGNIQLFKNKND